MMYVVLCDEFGNSYDEDLMDLMKKVVMSKGKRLLMSRGKEICGKLRLIVYSEIH